MRWRSLIPPRLPAPLPAWIVFSAIFAALCASHLTLLRLPYYWDEAGYYIPAAWDFFRTGSLIPLTTPSNAHPPLPSIYLALCWKAFGFSPFVTRLAVLVIASLGLTAVWRLAMRLSGVSAAALWTVVLTGLYPIWFAQSTLAHADIFAAACTLWGLVYILPARSLDTPAKPWAAALLFALAALSKETAIAFPLTLAFVSLVESLRASGSSRIRLGREAAWLTSCLLPLAAWYSFHYFKTGFLFGNPEFLRYNAQANLSLPRFLAALEHRVLHLTAHMNLFVPVGLATAALLLAPRTNSAEMRCAPSILRLFAEKMRNGWESPSQSSNRINGQLRPALAPSALRRISLLLLVNAVLYSVLGGALLTRYLLPLYPLVLLVAVTTFYRRVPYWHALAGFSAAAFILGLFINPPYGIAPEDNLTYARVIRLHQAGIRQLDAHYPGATVLSAWPVSDELSRPELGYLSQPYAVYLVPGFTAAGIALAADEPEKYSAALVFSTKVDTYSPFFTLGARSRAADELYFGLHHDLAPEQIARQLHGDLVWQKQDHGQWIALIRFNRQFDARLEGGWSAPECCPSKLIAASFPHHRQQPHNFNPSLRPPLFPGPWSLVPIPWSLVPGPSLLLHSLRKSFMLFKAHSAAVYGIDANLIDVEVDYSGIVAEKDVFHTVGLPDAAVRESRDRVRSAIKNSGYLIPPTHITINLAPADLKKEGSGFDLPIAVGILGAYGALTATDLSRFLLVGELGLDGSVRAVPGMLPVAILAREKNIPNLILPAANAAEAAVVEGVNVYPAASLLDVLELLNTMVVGVIQREPYRVSTEALLGELQHFTVDFKDVRGQQTAKRALEVAAAGSHNILMIGPPGSGKTMLAKRLPSILAPLTFEEALETTKIHSVAGVLDAAQGLVTQRPFRSPHHTISDAGLIGGGIIPRPGEVSLAHNGLLFLDELPEFPRNVLEVLRQPLEDHTVTIARASMSLSFPARFMLAAAMNPCPCGFFNDKSRECMCTPPMIQRYVAKISGPLLDRIDIHIEVPAVKYKELRGSAAIEGSAEIRARVLAARERQRQRFRKFGEKIYSNAQMTTRQIRAYCELGADAERLLERAMQQQGLTARAHDRILKVARTIADLEGVENLTVAHLAEAIQYRTLDRSYWA